MDRFLNVLVLCNWGIRMPHPIPIAYPRILSLKKCIPALYLRYPTTAGIAAAAAHTYGLALESGLKSWKTFAAKKVAVAVEDTCPAKKDRCELLISLVSRDALEPYTSGLLRSTSPADKVKRAPEILIASRYKAAICPACCLSFLLASNMITGMAKDAWKGI